MIQPGDRMFYRLAPSSHGGAFLEVCVVRQDRVAQLDFCPEQRRWVLVPRWRRWQDVDFSDWQPWPLLLEQERDEALRRADEEHAQDDAPEAAP